MSPVEAAKSALKIVLVEDDNSIRMFLKDAIENQCGHEVIGEAATGTDMVRTVLELEPDVVVFDIHLPHLDGLEALKQIYQTRIVAAVAITADRDQALVQRAMEEHVLAFLVKPVEAHQLAPALQRTDRISIFGVYVSDQRMLLVLVLLGFGVGLWYFFNRTYYGILMKRHRWSEADAFRRLQRGAMNRRIPMVDLAQAILNGEHIDLSSS